MTWTFSHSFDAKQQDAATQPSFRLPQKSNVSFLPDQPYASNDDKGSKTPKREKQRREDVQVLERVKTKKPPMYRVIIYNDDYTTQEFVVFILLQFFQKDGAAARQIMLKAHVSGRATIGVYTKDVAETKVTKATDYARDSGHPLMLSVEQDS